LRGSGFVGATAEEHDFAVAWNHVDGFFEFRGVHVNCARNRLRLRRKLKRMPQVHNYNVFTVFHAIVQFVSRDSCYPQAPQKPPPLKIFPSDIKHQPRNHKKTKAASEENEPGGHAFNLMAENVADADVGADPEHSSEGVEEGEAGPGHASGTSERRGHGVEPGDEFCDDESPGAAAFEMALRAADAGIGLEGDAAEEIQKLHAAAAAKFVPKDVGNTCGNNRQDEDGCDVHAACASESAGGEEQWSGGHWQAELFGEDPAEEQQVAVTEEKFEDAGHLFLLRPFARVT